MTIFITITITITSTSTTITITIIINENVCCTEKTEAYMTIYLSLNCLHATNTNRTGVPVCTRSAWLTNSKQGGEKCDIELRLIPTCNTVGLNCITMFGI